MSAHRAFYMTHSSDFQQTADLLGACCSQANKEIGSAEAYR